MKRNLFIMAAAIAVAATFTACQPDAQDQVPAAANTVEHTIYVDIDNDVFDDNAAAETGYSRALGADSVEIYVNGASTAAATLNAADIDMADEAEGYTQVAVKVAGELTDLKLVATGANIYTSSSDGGYESGTTNYSDTIDAFPLLSDLEGYSSFKDVEKFKMYSNDSWSSYYNAVGGLSLSCAPANMLSPDVSTSETSLYNERTLTAGQAEVLPGWVENPNSMTFDIYMFESNMYTKLSDIDDWTTAWSYEEITSTGRSVNGTTYKMEKVNSTALDAIHPAGDSYRSYLLTDLDSTGYYYIAVVTHFGNGTNFSSVKEIEIP